MPEISVIVPIYKAEPYLRAFLDNLIHQTFTDFQLVLVDDGSPDKSGEICDAYAGKDKRVLVLHKPNGGLASARKLGLQHAVGEYILQVDPDDNIEPTMLQEFYGEAMRTKADMVICDYWEHADGQEIYHKEEPKSLAPAEVMREMFTSLKGSVWNKLIRRSLYSKYDIDIPEDLILLEDLYQNFQLLLHPITISYVPEALYHYERNTNANSVTMAKSDRINGYLQAICHYFPALLKPHQKYWQLWVEHEMPWIAYAALYHQVFGAHKYKEHFYYLNGRAIQNANDRMVLLALKNYKLGTVVMSCRKLLSSLRHLL